MSNIQKLQAQFMLAFGQSVADKPIAIRDVYANWDEFHMHMKLVAEEIGEFDHAVATMLDQPAFIPDEPALAEVCAEAVDVVYVIMGMMNHLGLPFMEMFNAIHAANMAKTVDGKVIKNEAGKVLKPEGWQPADKLKVITDAIAGVAPEGPMVSISKEEYNELLDKERFLSACHEAGVDNWEGFAQALRIYGLNSI